MELLQLRSTGLLKPGVSGMIKGSKNALVYSQRLHMKRLVEAILSVHCHTQSFTFACQCDHADTCQHFIKVNVLRVTSPIKARLLD